MEERTFSHGHEEEVLELVDIVHSGMAPVEDGITELALEDGEPSEDLLELTDVVESPLELTEVVEPAGAEQAEECGLPELFGEAVPVKADHAPEEAAPEEEPSAPAFVDEETFLRLNAELEGRIRALEERHAAETRALEERLAASAEAQAALMEAFQSGMAAAESRHAAEVDELRAALSSAEGRALEVQALQERLASSEAAHAELSARMEVLQQQMAECSSLFLGDADLRLALEEMVSRMIEARMPAGAEAEELDGLSEKSPACEEGALPAGAGEIQPEAALSPEEAAGEAVPDAGELPSAPSAEEDARRAIVETIDELSLHVSELEERVASWEVRCEQEAALAAARVIREEIAAMRAGAARMGR